MFMHSVKEDNLRMQISFFTYKTLFVPVKLKTYEH